MTGALRVTGRRVRWLAPLALAATFVASVATATGQAATASTGVVQAVGAENQYANVIDQLGGRYVHVTAVISNPALDPHLYGASAQVAQRIAGAQLVVQNGVGYDAFMSHLESASPNSARVVIEAQSVLRLPSTTQNPHLWYDPKTMPAVAVKIERALVKLDPSHATYFAKRFVSFRASQIKLDRAIATFRQAFAGTKVATTEPVADYLLTALGLNNLTPFRFQADVMNGIDPSPEDIAHQQNLFTKHQVKLFFYNAQVSSSVTVALRSLAEKAGVPLVAVYETMPTPGYDFQSWMEAELNAMTKALTRHLSTKSL